MIVELSTEKIAAYRQELIDGDREAFFSKARDVAGRLVCLIRDNREEILNKFEEANTPDYGGTCLDYRRKQLRRTLDWFASFNLDWFEEPKPGVKPLDPIRFTAASELVLFHDYKVERNLWEAFSQLVDPEDLRYLGIFQLDLEVRYRIQDLRRTLGALTAMGINPDDYDRILPATA